MRPLKGAVVVPEPEPVPVPVPETPHSCGISDDEDSTLPLFSLSPPRREDVTGAFFREI
jgi:hypothetical protein